MSTGIPMTPEQQAANRIQCIGENVARLLNNLHGYEPEEKLQAAMQAIAHYCLFNLPTVTPHHMQELFAVAVHVAQGERDAFLRKAN